MPPTVYTYKSWTLCSTLSLPKDISCIQLTTLIIPIALQKKNLPPEKERNMKSSLIALALATFAAAAPLAAPEPSPPLLVFYCFLEPEYVSSFPLFPTVYSAPSQPGAFYILYRC